MMFRVFATLAATALIVTTACHAQSGIASVYGHSGRMTAAHRTLPFGTHVRVTNHRNGRSVIVTINDRGPFIRGRVIDLSQGAARALGFSGLASVSVERVGVVAERARTNKRVAVQGPAVLISTHAGN